MYKAIIIDDEEMARTLLNGMISEYCQNVSVIDLCKDLPSGVKSIIKNKPDIVFLDIEMPGHSGLELLDFFDAEDLNFSIIFVTAYNRYAVQAFKLSAIDYLLKPIEIEDLQNSILLFEKNKSNKNYAALKNNLNSTNKKIAIPSIHSISFIDLDSILFFQADGAYSQVFLNDGRILMTSKSLKIYENIVLEYTNFYRCHKSFIVNLNHITELVKSDGGYIKIKNHQIGISPHKVSILLEKLNL